ncbi:hypothetical protein BC834DRAFT_375000 [Gloeopeniophorella convolvens]|nr:hypothetical protein BC834DRAFT_375000 [Gloeopeniophorella convolvens]
MDTSHCFHHTKPFLLLSLPTELVIRIISFLHCADDISACLRSCRKLRDVVTDSQLLQYLLRTTFAGVHDTLTSGLTIPERTKVLQRWEDAWRDPAIQTPAQCFFGPATVPALNYATHDDYLIALREGPSPGYSFLDLRTSLPLQDALWTEVNVHTSAAGCTFTFAIEEHDLVIAIACQTPQDDTVSLELLPLSFSSGSPHPLASNAVIRLEVSSSEAKVASSKVKWKAEVVGDYVLLLLQTPASEYVYLVSWMDGKASMLRESVSGRYAPGFVMVSRNIVAFVCMERRVIELCGVFPGSQHAAPSIKTLCCLDLPALKPGERMFSASCHGEHIPVHDYTQHDATSTRPAPRLPFRTSPEDALVEFVLGVEIVSPHFVYGPISLTTSRPALREIARSTTPGATVPWAAWGPVCAQVSLLMAGTKHRVFGSRWATTSFRTIGVRDFNAYRVGAAGGNGVVRSTVIPSGGVFGEEVVSRQPFLQTKRTRLACDDFLADSERLLAFSSLGGDDPQRSVQIDLHVFG